VAQLQQPSSGLADCLKMTFSGWFFAPSANVAGQSAVLLEFGDTGSGPSPPAFGPSTIFAQFVPGTLPIPYQTLFWFQLYGAKDNTNFTRYIANAGVPAPYSPDTGTGTGNLLAVYFSPNPCMDQWVHVFASVDLTQPGGYNTGPTACNFLVNGAAAGPPPSGISFYLLNALEGNLNGVFRPIGPDPPEFPSPGGTFINFDQWPMSINGTQFAIPAQDATGGGSGDLDSQPSIHLAEYQMWFGTYIDPSNIRMFIDAHGKPVDPSVPARAFGTQSVLLRRNKDMGLRFDFNEGLGGPFVQRGTITDYTPGPF
jgi:hypothetical protein